MPGIAWERGRLQAASVARLAARRRALGGGGLCCPWAAAQGVQDMVGRVIRPSVSTPFGEGGRKNPSRGATDRNAFTDVCCRLRSPFNRRGVGPRSALRCAMRAEGGPSEVALYA